MEIIRVICTGNRTHREIIMRSFNYGRLITATRTVNGVVQWGKGYDDWRDRDNPSSHPTRVTPGRGFISTPLLDIGPG